MLKRSFLFPQLPIFFFFMAFGQEADSCGLISPLGDVHVYHLTLMPGVFFSVLSKLSHFLVPFVLCLLGLANQRHLLLQPLSPVSLVLLCAQLHRQHTGTHTTVTTVARTHTITVTPVRQKGQPKSISVKLLPSNSLEPKLLPDWLVMSQLNPSSF